MLTELIKSAPSLAVLCFIVITFIRYIRSRDADVREIHNEHIKERELSRSAVEANTVALARNSVVMSDLIDTIAVNKQK